MALIGIFQFKGITVPDAVLKILDIRGGDSGWMVDYAVFANAIDDDPLFRERISVGYRAGADPVSDAEDMILQMPQYLNFARVSPKRISRLEFLQKFTTAERLGIRTAAKQNVALEDYLALVDVAQFIDVTRPDTIGGVQYLESVGLLGPGRANEILGIVTP